MNNNKKLKVLLAGRSERALKPLAQALARAPGIVCSIHLISDGQTDTLSDLEPLPDALVLRFDADDLSELAALADSSADSRPPLIMVGPPGIPEAMRLAVRSGARDFLPEPVEAGDLIASLEALRNEPARGTPPSHRAALTVVVGAAGGVGTSLIACNLALAIAGETKAPTLLLDLDVNAAPLASFLDLSPERGLPSALSEVEFLDEQALPGYVAKHHSGLRLMGTPSPSRVSPKDIDPDRFAKFMGVLMANFRHIVADASHTLDDLSVETISMARTVVIVLQQSVMQVKQATRLLNTLCNEIGVPIDRIRIVVNRYVKRSPVALEDIQRALGRQEVTVLPSHYKSVLASIDSGIPLLEYDRSSPVAREIIDLQREIVSGHHVEHRSLLRRALPIFSGD
jgi:pilus assembly protein CpaE